MGWSLYEKTTILDNIWEELKIYGVLQYCKNNNKKKIQKMRKALFHFQTFASTVNKEAYWLHSSFLENIQTRGKGRFNTK